MHLGHSIRGTIWHSFRAASKVTRAAGTRQGIMSSTDKLKDAFAQSLGLNGVADFDHLAYGSTTGWDSVAHMALVASIESAFDIMLSTDDVIDMSSFSKAKQIVAKYGVAFDA
jgi:acyl carrier protein